VAGNLRYKLKNMHAAAAAAATAAAIDNTFIEQPMSRSAYQGNQ
jgi:hypothetical protein